MSLANEVELLDLDFEIDFIELCDVDVFKCECVMCGIRFGICGWKHVLVALTDILGRNRKRLQ